MGPRSQILSIFFALFLVSVASVMSQSPLLKDPSSLSQFPTIEQIKAGTKGTDDVDSHARFMAALWRINDIIKEDLVKAPNAGYYQIPLTAKTVQSRYSGAITRYGIDEPPPAARDPRFRPLEQTYEKNPVFFDGLLTQFFSPKFRTEYYAWIRKPVPQQTVGTGVGPPSRDSQANSSTTADSLALGRALSGPQVWVAEARKLRAEKNEAAALVKFDTAANKYKEIIANYPHSRFPGVVKAYEGLGEIYQTGLRRYDLALPIWQALRKLKPNDAEIAVLVGQSLYGLKRNDEAFLALSEALALRPKPNIAAIAHANIGWIYEDKASYDKAVLEHQEAQRIDPSNGKSYFDLGNVYLKMGKKAEAIAVYNKLLVINKEYAADLLNEIDHPATGSSSKALNHLSQGNQFFNDRAFDRAIAEYQAVIALKPEKKLMLDAHQGLAASYEFLSNLNKAIQNYLQMTILEPSNSSNFWILGDRYFQTLQYAKAAAAFKEAIRLKPTERLHYSELGQAYLMLGKKAEAMQAYDSLLKIDKNYASALLDQINDPGGATALLANKSQVLISGRDQPTALAYLQAALNIKPANPYGLLKVGETFSVLDRYEEAISTFRKVIALKPKPETAAEAFSFIGLAYSAQNQYAKAIPEFKESLRIKPDYYSTRELGHCYFNLKDYPSALAAYQQAIRLKPDNADSHFAVGIAYAAMDQFDRALAAYNEAARLDPKSGRGFTAIGQISLQLKKYPDAGRAFSAALRIDPKDKAALFGIGSTYFAIGRKADAMRAYAALKPLDEKLAQQLLDEINKR